MNSRQLQYAILLSETLNFSQVADQLGISQPSLSKQILALEAELGIKLFDRNHSPMTVTPAGEYFIEEARELLRHHEMIRVTSKYPNIAREHFYNRKHQTVEIIKLNGSVELGPIVDLGDVIVDIVETGSTLRENGLAVLEEVCPVSARMIVNQVSMQMKTRRIREIMANVRDCLE